MTAKNAQVGCLLSWVCILEKNAEHGHVSRPMFHKSESTEAGKGSGQRGSCPDQMSRGFLIDLMQAKSNTISSQKASTISQLWSGSLQPHKFNMDLSMQKSF